MTADLELATRTIGDEGPRVAFVHGLFGQGRNWTTVARRLADPAEGAGHRVTLVDLPNHGHSPWTSSQDYGAMAADVASPDRRLCPL